MNGLGEPHLGEQGARVWGGVSLFPVCAPHVLWGQALLWVSGQLKGRLG